jgi:hypothetical protein
LARYLGPDDLQLSGLKETYYAGIPYTDRVCREAGELCGRGPWTRIEHKIQLAGFLGPDRRAERIRKGIHSVYRAALGPYPYHARAAAIAKAFPEEWAAFHKFCVVRNPWDKTVSDYFWRTRKTDTPPSFESFVKAIRDGETLSGIVPGEPDNWPLYTIDDRIAVDRVIRFENLTRDLDAVLSSLGIAWDSWLPHGKKRAARKTSDFASIPLYTPELIRIVGDLFENEIRAFKYQGPHTSDPG